METRKQGSDLMTQMHDKTRIKTNAWVNTTHDMNSKLNINAVLFTLRNTSCAERGNL